MRAAAQVKAGPVRFAARGGGWYFEMREDGDMGRENRTWRAIVRLISAFMNRLRMLFVVEWEN